MARLGMFCLPWTGHLNPFAALSHELAARGHEVVFFHLADFGEQVRRHGFRFEAYGECEHPAGSFARRYREMSRMEGLAASQAALSILTEQAEVLFEAGPEVIEKAGLDLWVIDHMDYAVSTLAARLGVPFVSVIVGLMRHMEEGVPGFSGEIYGGDEASRERDRLGNERMLAASQPFREFVSAYRVRNGMLPFAFDRLWSTLAQISQQPAGFEFPRRELPDCFHFTGPFARKQARPEVEFPWAWLDGRPLVYASFGTTQNRNHYLHEAVVRAAEGLDAQVVVSMGGAEAGELADAAPGNVLVVPFAPQLELLERASLMITHAGMNSTLECLAAGVPMVGIPIAHDQPGVSARIVWTGTGVRIAASECEPGRLRGCIETVLGEPGYRAAARRFQTVIAKEDGLARAAGIIERVLATGRPVLRAGPVAES